MTQRLIHIAILLLSYSYLRGQTNDSISVISGAFIEDLIENNDETNYDFFSLYDDLKAYLADPLNINKADADELRALTLFNDIQIDDLLQHRSDYGDLLSPYELQSIPSMDVGTLNAVIPFVTVGAGAKTKDIGRLFQEADHSVVGKYKRVLQDKKGYGEDASSPYLGNADYYYLRYNMTSGRNLRVGITMEKDAGEEFFTGSNREGFDYYSGFIFFRDVHPIVKALNVGDFSISMGQGLILHNSFGSGKSSFVMDVKRGGQVIRPYSSVNEFNLLRGVASTFQVSKQVEVSAFYSNKNIDGNSLFNDTIIDTGFDQFSSFVINGLHRTQNEIDKKGAINQVSAGVVARIKLSNNLKFGINGLTNKFSSQLSPKDDPYRLFSFRGDELTNVSFDYSYRYQNFNLFGETARSSNGGLANIHGALISMGRNVDASIIYRNYAKDYHVLNGNAFGEGSQPVNEQGIYLGLQFRPWRSITVNTYFDTWRHPWLRFKVDAPSSGREFLFKVEYRKRRKYSAYMQYRYEEKGENVSGFTSSGVRPITNKRQHRARLNFVYTYSKELNLTSRIEYNHFTKEDLQSQGYLFYQDVKYKPVGRPYSFAARYTLFDTDDFNSRIYSYENDVLYEFSVPFLYESGTRFYIKGQYRISRNMYIQLRYSRTFYNNLEDILQRDGTYAPIAIGSGNEQSIGRVRSDLKFVIKYTIK